MPAKRGRPATGATKTNKSLTIDTEILARAEAEIARRGGRESLSSLVEYALVKLLGAPVSAEAESSVEALPAATIIPLAPPRPHILAAAGSPITAEVTDWEAGDGKVLVRLSGLSMAPKLNDGDVIEMRHKSTARSPFMKKGLIYLLEYDGGYTVKRYNTRKATEEEKGEEWVENGKVKILESINPDYPEIVIKDQVDWIAWLDEK